MFGASVSGYEHSPRQAQDKHKSNRKNDGGFPHREIDTVPLPQQWRLAIDRSRRRPLARLLLRQNTVTSDHPHGYPEPVLANGRFSQETGAPQNSTAVVFSILTVAFFDEDFSAGGCSRE
jgi:hypothetical protein